MMPARKLRKDWDPSQEQTTFRDVVWALLWGVFLVAVALLMPASCAHSYYANAIPGSGSCYSMGAYGVCP